MIVILWVMFPFAVLANWQMVETFHHGSIFKNLRARLEQMKGFIPDLLLCPFCLSHWTAFSITTACVLYIHDNTAAANLHSAPFILFFYSLAITRASNVLNDLGHKHWRTPREVDGILPDTGLDYIAKGVGFNDGSGTDTVQNRASDAGSFGGFGSDRKQGQDDGAD